MVVDRLVHQAHKSPTTCVAVLYPSLPYSSISCHYTILSTKKKKRRKNCQGKYKEREKEVHSECKGSCLVACAWAHVNVCIEKATVTCWSCLVTNCATHIPTMFVYKSQSLFSYFLDHGSSTGGPGPRVSTGGPPNICVIRNLTT